MQPLDTENQPVAGEQALYEHFAEPLLAYVLSQVAQRQDAEDLLLEVFLAAIQNRELVHLPPERQLAWLRRTARNKIIDHYRRSALLVMQPLEQVHTSIAEQHTPEERIEAREQFRQLQRAIDQLTPEQRELVRLRYAQELRLTQIAELLQKPASTVRKTLSRTLRRLHDFYKKEQERSPYHDR